MGNIHGFPDFSTDCQVVINTMPSPFLEPGYGIHSLPAEVMLDIIKLTGTPIKMSVLCSAFRSICLSHKSLWVNLTVQHCRDVQAIPLYLLRSGNSPLKLSMHLTGPSRYPNDYGHTGRRCTGAHAFPPSLAGAIAIALSCHFDRMQALSIDLDVGVEDISWIDTILTDYDDPVPNLRSLSIRGEDEPRITLPVTVLTGHIPALRDLTFAGSMSMVPVLHQDFVSSPLERLLLEIHNTSSATICEKSIWSILDAHAATLIDVEIRVFQSPYFQEPEDPFPSSRLHMPVLRRLVLRSFLAPLPAIDAPHLAIFEVAVHNLRDIENTPDNDGWMVASCPEAQRAITSFIQRHSDVLENVSLHISCEFHDHSIPPERITLNNVKTLMIETNRSFKHQIVLIDAPSLTTFKYLPIGEPACFSTFEHINLYAATIQVFQLDAFKIYSLSMDRELRVFPMPLRKLRRLEIRAPSHSDMMALLQSSTRRNKMFAILVMTVRGFTWDLHHQTVPYFGVCLDGFKP